MVRVTGTFLAAMVVVASNGCRRPGFYDPAPPPQAVALTRDREYRDVRLSESKRAEHEAKLAAAEADYDADRTDEEAIIWYGRRLAYLGHFRGAIGAFSTGLNHHPRSVRLLRHRGHRYLTVRDLDRAERDLRRAAELIRLDRVPDEIEPDGLPNARNIPLSTLHDNVYYHLALARYLKGDFDRAADAWRTGLERVKPNDDMLVAYSFWLYLAESRAGQPERAAAVLSAVGATLDIIENEAYLRALRVAQGRLTEAEARGPATEGPEGATTDSATLLHGLGALALIRGDAETARARFEECMRTDQWPAFGFIAAEAELARMARTDPRAEERIHEETIREMQRERQGIR